MANLINKPVSLKVDKLYFDNIFEPDRKKLSQKIGRNFTQREYTAYLARKRLRIRIKISTSSLLAYSSSSFSIFLFNSSSVILSDISFCY